MWGMFKGKMNVVIVIKMYLYLVLSILWTYEYNPEQIANISQHEVCNGWVPSRQKNTCFEPMLIKFYAAIWRHLATLG